MIKIKKYHLFHLVNPSPWPIVTSFSIFIMLVGLTLYMHNLTYGLFILVFGVLVVLFSMYLWWKDVIREGLYEGFHTQIVKQGLRYGMLLFILSELMFFFAFFWAFFHSSLSPSIEIGAKWPPSGIQTINCWSIPLVNTILLLLSGSSITWSHHALLANKQSDSTKGLIVTIFLGIIFTALQLYEYFEANFTISDGVYGSTFYMATGFHGLHVIVGTIFLIVCLFRQLNKHFTADGHVGFECAIWYWHFVDIIWLFLFFSVYCWGNS
uniref:Cytochrome c oxidase subunit 3 n=1 Tax=Cyanoptyche gloeocystis TaxID=77922 RepID=A0A096Y6V3_9EUKA|nr:cytochrome c oxidase subunit 3 [Cyanoptyche gloeocystis]AIM52058.1 cytochrome c oxidase subunit 3 [Cyanoptyche gloeocystis]